jgi:acyl-CoA synthetase (AMP-forming)/AMP-acid ligase II
MPQLKQKFDEALQQLTAAGAPFELCDGPDPGTPCKRFKNAPRNMAELFAPGAAHGDKEFVLYEGERWSFTRMYREAAALGHQLVHGYGLGKGDRVAIAMRNYPEWMAAFIGISSVGATVVPLNSWGSADDIEFGLSDSGSRMVFCDQQRYEMLKDRFEHLQVIPVTVRPGGHDHGSDAVTYGDLLAGAGNAAMPGVEIHPDDEAMIMYTSGTTGRPKGALSTQQALCQSVFSTECMGAAMMLCNADRLGVIAETGYEPSTLMSVPLFHVSGCHATFLVSIRSGRRIVMMYKWDVDKAYDFVERERISHIGGAPVQILDFFDSPRFTEADTSSLVSFGIGGAATPPRIRALLQKHIPHHMSGTGWGMTETNSVGTSFMGVLFQEKAGSSGICHPIVELSIRNEQGEELALGEQGIIWVRSIALIREYWNRPEANAEHFRDGWFNSGDIGRLDEHGYLYVSDRAKDMIIRGGENIYPVEIENRLLEHPGIRETAVFGVPDPRMGEDIAVVVRLEPGTAMSAEEFREYASEHLAAYKVPTRVFFTEDPLPRNATNKLLKQVIREQYD